MNTTNTMTGYIYVRQHDFSDKYDLYRIGKSENIINTEIENISMEIERGELIKVFKFINISNNYLNTIYSILKNNLKEYMHNKGPSTEFFKKVCIDKISIIFEQYKLNFIELTKLNINQLSTKIYEINELNRINKLNEQKNNRLIKKN